ncbi:MAG: hypothetical protein ABWX68_08310 [Arthrobacter sp.]|uniref:hypothetical protein n=1 Tax=Arthrobacter sp. TaxID=1667 RepID=UPI00349412E3
MGTGEPQTSTIVLAVLVELLGAAGPVDRALLLADLAEDGRDVGAVLQQLVDERFVDDAGRVVELSDRGWHWLGQELTARPDEELLEELEEDERRAAHVLYAFMNLLGAYLENTDLSLGEFVMAARRVA